MDNINREECDRRHTLLEKKLDEMIVMVRNIEDAIKGTYDKDGILLRVDRLEQEAKTKAKIVWLILGAIIVLMVNSTFNFIKENNNAKNKNIGSPPIASIN